MFPTAGELKTSIGRLPIRLAGAADLDVVFDVMCDAATWLASRGIQQWMTVPTPPFKAFLGRRIASHAVYLLEHQSAAVATICLQTADPDTWGDVGNDGSAGYIHGLATRAALHGNGLGKEMLAWAERIFAGQGRSFLRLDAMAENERLCGYYLGLGFTEITIKQFGTWSVRLYEKAI